MKFTTDKNRIILIPDSFKGTISATEVCDIMANSVRKFIPDVEITAIPVADGGEGTVEALQLAVGGEIVNIDVKGPLMQDMKSFYGILPNGSAVIEVAAVVGLPQMEKLAVMDATTYGVGQLISDALAKGHTEIVIGLGGSATNDGGAGACAALGIKFFDKDDNEFVPVGKTLIDIARIDVSGKDPKLNNATIKLMSDINNPLCGERGAAAVFGPQKGATESDVIALDAGLKNFAEIVKRDVGVDIIDVPGAGAAGGIGGGFYGLLNGKLEMGIDVILDIVKFDELLADTSIVFTGEGKIDSQSLGGKVVIGIAKRAKKQNVPLVAVVGDIGDNMDEAYDYGVTAIMSTNRVAVPFKEAKPRAKSDLSLAMDEIMRLLTLE
ncbi:MAG: glycerate kinase [Clostridiaceae bacterium]|nr:glycerate kinase [Clostridiaceae bacterium]